MQILLYIFSFAIGALGVIYAPYHLIQLFLYNPAARNTIFGLVCSCLFVAVCYDEDMLGVTMLGSVLVMLPFFTEAQARQLKP